MVSATASPTARTTGQIGIRRPLRQPFSRSSERRPPGQRRYGSAQASTAPARAILTAAAVTVAAQGLMGAKGRLRGVGLRRPAGPPRHRGRRPRRGLPGGYRELVHPGSASRSTSRRAGRHRPDPPVEGRCRPPGPERPAMAPDSIPRSIEGLALRRCWWLSCACWPCRSTRWAPVSARWAAVASRRLSAATGPRPARPGPAPSRSPSTKRPRHSGGPGPLAHDGGVGGGAQQQSDGLDQHGLAGTGLTGEGRHPGAQIQIDQEDPRNLMRSSVSINGHSTRTWSRGSG